MLRRASLCKKGFSKKLLLSEVYELTTHLFITNSKYINQIRALCTGYRVLNGLHLSFFYIAL